MVTPSGPGPGWDQRNPEPALLTRAEVAALFHVNPKTVTRWANEGKLTTTRTLGGHRRYLEQEVRTLMDGLVEIRADAISGPPRHKDCDCMGCLPWTY